MRLDIILSIFSTIITLALLFYFVLPLFLIFIGLGLAYLAIIFLWSLITGQGPTIKVVNIKTNYSNPYGQNQDPDVIETTTADKDQDKLK
ncbi:MAG: hypothetical protein ACRCS8_06255 [Brevinema sp.]